VHDVKLSEDKLRLTLTDKLKDGVVLHRTRREADSYVCDTPMAERVSLCAWAGLVSRRVPRTDVNPRSVSPLAPSGGIIGCESADGSPTLP
jgi:hypothetical protein